MRIPIPTHEIFWCINHLDALLGRIELFELLTISGVPTVSLTIVLTAGTLVIPMRWVSTGQRRRENLLRELGQFDLILAVR